MKNSTWNESLRLALEQIAKGQGVRCNSTAEFYALLERREPQSPCK